MKAGGAGDALRFWAPRLIYWLRLAADLGFFVQLILLAP
jgi:hypothetical protein